MGLRDRIARLLATEDIAKGPNLPAGSNVISTDALMAQGGLAMQQTYGSNIATRVYIVCDQRSDIELR